MNISTSPTVIPPFSLEYGGKVEKMSRSERRRESKEREKKQKQDEDQLTIDELTEMQKDAEIPNTTIDPVLDAEFPDVPIEIRDKMQTSTRENEIKEIKAQTEERKVKRLRHKNEIEGQVYYSIGLSMTDVEKRLENLLRKLPQHICNELDSKLCAELVTNMFPDMESLLYGFPFGNAIDAEQYHIGIAIRFLYIAIRSFNAGYASEHPDV